ncbi:MAG: hypothetical protein H8F28_22240, partial [Fibrella sp.]|nr:hypothetical protein [Armatimonadota bacterium]
MNRNTVPMPPDDLLARCLDTIPAATTIEANTDSVSGESGNRTSRLSLDTASRRRLLWLGGAAAVPVLSLLFILPIHRMNNSETSLKQDVLSPSKNASVPYVRIHKWERQMMRDGLTTPDYRVVIYDGKRGRSEWQTDDHYQTIKTPTDRTPSASIHANNGLYYTEYHRAGRYCSIKKRKRTTRDGLSGYDWARNPRALASYHPGGRLVKTETVLWQGKNVERQEYTGITDEHQAMKIQELDIRQAAVTQQLK